MVQPRTESKTMLQNLAIKIGLKLLVQAICQIFGYCCDCEECPDGSCVELFKDCDEFGNCTPEPTVATPQAFDFNPDWSVFTELVDDARRFIATLRRFLGLAKNVG